MKRLFCLILTILFLFSLAACKAEPSPAPSETTQQTTVPTETKPAETTEPETTADTEPSEEPTEEPTEPEEPELPLVAALISSVCEEKYADDGRMIFSYTYPIVTVTAPDRGAASAISTDLSNRVDFNRGEAEDIGDLAVESYDGSEYFYYYFYEHSYSVSRVDSSVLSFSGYTMSYSGGVHPISWLISANYDVQTGAYLHLEDIVNDESGIAYLRQTVMNTLSRISETEYLFDDYASVAETHFVPGNAEADRWYFTPSGLTFYFCTYEISSYAFGETIVEIPYESLTDVLKAQYLPNSVPSDGSLLVSFKSDLDMEAFTQTADLPLNSIGESFVLYSDGTISNLVGEQGYWSEDGETFFASSTVFAVNSLSRRTAAILQTWIPDGMPNLRISYESAGSHYSYYLMQSGNDGSIILMDAASG